MGYFFIQGVREIKFIWRLGSFTPYEIINYSVSNFYNFTGHNDQINETGM